ncbi:hypothetical protein PHLH5_14080 [Pseudomonas sp. Cab53]|uniref:Uncharacterized protein n=2 Tax=Pseudomonas TaxID=286 RepID=A0A0G3GP75_9PSED|nr:MULTISPECIES: hypothetical protein [Pseudomonas]AKK01313.1 hypothetical protein VM99_25835 [Pseudomonas chlororaphis]KIQ56700.1 hypothetical protein RL74_24685 [Pseudomonas fluorescens]BBP63867.1 hypothetical protein PHLH5_14080 [Pseudomonas sp. Cab53]
MTVSQSVLDDLWRGEKSICFFVHAGKCYWVVDEKYNFSLDAEKDYRAYLDSGEITQEQYEQSCKSFRGGILKMTAENFPQYLGDSSGKILSPSDLNDFIGADFEVFEKVEYYFLTGEGLTQDLFKRANMIHSRFPRFYINFDRKIFMHMDDARVHEGLAYPDWIAECFDFSFLIPASERYWVVAGNDYWKLRFV